MFSEEGEDKSYTLWTKDTSEVDKAEFSEKRKVFHSNSHKYLATVIDHKTNDNRHYEVIENASDGDLSGFLKDDRRKILELFAKIVESVFQMMKDGIQFNVLRQEQILMGESGEPKIIDYNYI